MLAPMPNTQMPNIHCLIPSRLLTNPERAATLKLLEQEVYECYLASLRKGIGNSRAQTYSLLVYSTASG